MTVVDLSQVISKAMPVYPGTKPPEIEEVCRAAALLPDEKDGIDIEPIGPGRK